MNTILYLRYSPRVVRCNACKKPTTHTGEGKYFCKKCDVHQSDDIVASLNVQEESCRRYCTMAGLTVMHVVREPHISAGTWLADRPGGEQLIEMLNNGSADHVCVQKLDRLFRDTPDGLMTIEEWGENEITLHLSDEGGNCINCSTAIGYAFVTMRLMMSTFERKNSRERTSAAMKHRQRNGEVMSARAPFGYRIEGNRLIEVDEEQALITIMREQEGLTHSQIAAVMNEQGHRMRNGGHWVARYIERCLS